MSLFMLVLSSAADSILRLFIFASWVSLESRVESLVYSISVSESTVYGVQSI